MKQITCTFNFDPETESVSDLTIFVDGIEKKKKTTTRSTKTKEPEVLEDTPKIILEPNKLSFNNRAIADMKIEYQDRILIKYEKDPTVKGKKLVPFIGRDLDWNEEGSGNKTTKTNTVSYRGNANKVLAEFGSEFTIEATDKEGIWKLVSLDKEPSNIEEVQEAADDITPEIFIDDDDTTEIGEITFKF